jgi:DNA-binding MarR family transcriptional regulator
MITNRAERAGRTDVSRTSGSVAAEAPTFQLVRQLEQAVRTVLEDALRPQGLTCFRWAILSILLDEGSLTSAELARRTFLTPQSMNESIRNLVMRGIVVRERSSEDRRALLVTLTPKGRQLAMAGSETVRELEEDLLGDMDDANRDSVRAWLLRTHAAVLDRLR